MLMAPVLAHGETPKEVTFAAGQPAMSISTAFYSSLPEGAKLTEKFAGVKVIVQPTAGSTASMQAVSAGNAFYTWAGVVPFLDIAQRDPNLVMVSFDPGNPYRVSVMPDSPVRTPADLKGRKIGVQSFASANYSMGLAVVAAAGLNPKKDVSFIPVGVGAPAANALRSGAIDAYAGNDANTPIIELLLGRNLRALDSPVNDLPGMNGIVVARQSIKDQPKLVAGLCRAFYASYMYADANKQATVLNHWMTYPSQVPSDVPREKALADGVRLLEARIKVDAHPGPDGLYGYQPIEKMQQVLETLKRLDAIGEVPDLNKYVDLRFAKECGTIDVAELTAEAKAWVPSATR